MPESENTAAEQIRQPWTRPVLKQLTGDLGDVENVTGPNTDSAFFSSPTS